jgi:undecaprenyl-diphosphatase
VNSFYAVLLGIIQGLTEFLPISSTAHLTLTGKLLGLIDEQNAQAWTAFIAVMQLGTLAAVVVYFFKDVVGMVISLIRDVRSNGMKSYSRESKLAIYIIMGTIPIGLVGILTRDILHGMFTKNVLVIIAGLVALAALLWLAEKVAQHVRSIDQMTLRDALLIGVAQILALIPGSSRSGTTITAGLFLNYTRYAAARFSFLLSIPAVMASGLYELTTINENAFQFGVLNLVIATVVSAISGYAAIAWLLRFLVKNTTMVFVWYRVILGFAFAIMLLFGIIQP